MMSHRKIMLFVKNYLNRIVVSASCVVITLLLLMGCNSCKQDDLKSSDENWQEEANVPFEKLTVYSSAGIEPFYARFLFIPKNYVAYKLPTPQTGQYRILIGANDVLSGKLGSLMNFTITDSHFRPIASKSSFAKDSRRVFMEILFAAKEDAVFFELWVDEPAYQALPAATKEYLKKSIIGEIGFGKFTPITDQK